MTRRASFPLLVGMVIAAVVWWLLRERSSETSPPPPSPAAAPRPQQPSADARAPFPPPSPSPAMVPSPPPAGRVLLRATWGSGPDQLGRSRPSEANPEGPSSFAIDSSGHLWVLDKVNGRVVRYDESGRPIGSFQTTLRSPQELLVAPDGALLVLDRLADKRVAILGEDGRLRGELPLEGEGLARSGDATGLFTDDQGVYVESGHSQLVRIGDTTGKLDPGRPLLDGRPSRDGKRLLSAGIIDPDAGRLWVRALDRASGKLQFQRRVTLTLPYLALVFLDTDKSGGIYLGAHVGRELSPGKMTDEAIQVVCLGPEGEVRGLAVLPANTLPEESFRDLALLDDGTIVYMERTEAGVTIGTHRCRDIR